MEADPGARLTNEKDYKKHAAHPFRNAYIKNHVSFRLRPEAILSAQKERKLYKHIGVYKANGTERGLD